MLWIDLILQYIQLCCFRSRGHVGTSEKFRNLGNTFTQRFQKKAPFFSWCWGDDEVENIIEEQKKFISEQEVKLRKYDEVVKAPQETVSNCAEGQLPRNLVKLAWYTV